MIGRSRHLIVGLFAILIFIFSSFGQTKTATLESLELREKRAFEQMRKTPYRVMMTIEVRNSEIEEWRPYSCFITEYTAGRSYERRCAEPLRERIQIGNDTYLRMPDGSWQLNEKKDPPGTPWKREPSNVEIVKLGPDAAPEDGSVGFGVRSRTRTQRPADGRVFETTGTGNIWFDEQGRLVRRESVNFSEIPSAGRFSRRVEDYEYDESIRIDIPVVAK